MKKAPQEHPPFLIFNLFFNLRKFTPAILTLLIFLLAQGIGSLLLFVTGMLISPEFNTALRAYFSGEAQSLPMLELLPVSLFSISLMATNILAILVCCLFLHNIRFVTAPDIRAINWRTGAIAVAAGILGAISISIMTETVELPDIMKQMSLEMSHDFWGMLALVIIGPITEELLFREAIEGEMLRRGANPWTAIIVSALAFSIVHLNLAQGLYALPLAIIFGIIYYKTGNIVLTSILHIINNGIAAIQLYTFGTDIEDISYADWFGGKTQAYTVMLITGILCLTLTKIFWDKYQPPKETKKHEPLAENAKNPC